MEVIHKFSGPSHGIVDTHLEAGIPAPVWGIEASKVPSLSTIEY
jgi:hypothetical protein